MPTHYEALRAESDKRLIDFLQAELAIGTTLVESAKLAKESGHMEHFEQAKEAAETAAATVRRFMDQIQDGPARSEIAERLTELD